MLLLLLLTPLAFSYLPCKDYDNSVKEYFFSVFPISERCFVGWYPGFARLSIGVKIPETV